MKRLFKYDTSGVLINETTTVVTGLVFTKDYKREQIGQELDKIDKLCHAAGYDKFNFSTLISCKGVAHLSPEDKYDEDKGRILAARKAELKGIIKLHKRDTAILAEVEHLERLIRQNVEDEALREMVLTDQINRAQGIFPKTADVITK